MGTSTALIKELREKTGVGIMDCKTALKECDNDINKAIDFLRKKGIATAKKRGVAQPPKDRSNPIFTGEAK